MVYIVISKSISLYQLHVTENYIIIILTVKPDY